MVPKHKNTDNAEYTLSDVHFEHFKQEITAIKELYLQIKKGASHLLFLFNTKMTALDKLYEEHGGTAMNEYSRTIHMVFWQDYKQLQRCLTALNRSSNKALKKALLPPLPALLPLFSEEFGFSEESRGVKESVSAHLGKRKQPRPMQATSELVVGKTLVFSENLGVSWLKIYGDEQDLSLPSVFLVKKFF